MQPVLQHLNFHMHPQWDYPELQRFAELMIHWQSEFVYCCTKFSFITTLHDVNLQRSNDVPNAPRRRCSQRPRGATAVTQAASASVAVPQRAWCRRHGCNRAAAQQLVSQRGSARIGIPGRQSVAQDNGGGSRSYFHANYSLHGITTGPSSRKLILGWQLVPHSTGPAYQDVRGSAQQAHTRWVHAQFSFAVLYIYIYTRPHAPRARNRAAPAHDWATCPPAHAPLDRTASPAM
jgi:hypothetical protein